MIVQEKCFSSYILLTDQVSLPDCLYFLRYWSICVLQELVSNQVVFPHDQNVRTKVQISWEQNDLWTWNKKHFSSFLKGFQLTKVVSDLRVRFKYFFMYVCKKINTNVGAGLATVSVTVSISMYYYDYWVLWRRLKESYISLLKISVKTQPKY